MVHALEQGLKAGHRRILVLGSDAPTLPIEHVRELLSADSDVALGPATDGGFYAIAARRTHPSMFAGVEWSRPDTLGRTVQAIEAAGLNVELGPSWFDIDEMEDLMRLTQESDLPPHTAACLDRLIGARKGTC